MAKIRRDIAVRIEKRHSAPWFEAERRGAIGHRTVFEVATKAPPEQI
jgi:hypothetical protein